MSLNPKILKDSLIQNLSEDVYVKVGISQVGRGKELGVFAIRDIPKGEDPFKLSNSDEEVIWLTEEEINELPIPARNILTKFIYPDETTKMYAVPPRGLNSIDVSYYCNCKMNRDEVNIQPIMNEDSRGMSMIQTTRLIREGEELFLPPYDIKATECANCYNKVLNANEMKNITGCSCITSLFCTSCALESYSKSLIPTISLIKGGETDYSAKCALCKNEVSKEFIESVLNYQQPSFMRDQERVEARKRLKTFAEREREVPFEKGLSHKKAKSNYFNKRAAVRPEGGEEGVVWMEEDRDYHPVSIYTNEWISAAERNELQKTVYGRDDGPRRINGITPYRYFSKGPGRPQIVEDNFSDGDETVMLLNEIFLDYLPK